MASQQLKCSLCDKELTGNIIRLNLDSCLSHWTHSQCLNGYPGAPTYICAGCNSCCGEIVKGCVVSTLVSGIWNGIPHQSPNGQIRFVERPPGMAVNGRNNVEGFDERFDDENETNHVQEAPAVPHTVADGTTEMDETCRHSSTYGKDSTSSEESSGIDGNLANDAVWPNEFDLHRNEQVNNVAIGSLERDSNYQRNERVESQFARNERIGRVGFGVDGSERIGREHFRHFGTNERLGGSEFDFRGNERMVRDHDFGTSERFERSEFGLRENEQVRRADLDHYRTERNENFYRVNEQPRLGTSRFCDYQQMERPAFNFGGSERVIGDGGNLRRSNPVYRDDLGFRTNHQMERTENFRPLGRNEFGFQDNERVGPDAFGFRRYEQSGRTPFRSCGSALTGRSGFTENERVIGGNLRFHCSYPLPQRCSTDPVQWDMGFQRHPQSEQQARFRGMSTDIGLRGTEEIGQGTSEFLRSERVDRNEFGFRGNEPMGRTDSEFRRHQRLAVGEFNFPNYERVGRVNSGHGGNDPVRGNHGRYDTTEGVESDFLRFRDEDNQEQMSSFNGEGYIEAEAVTTRQQRQSTTMNENGTGESPVQATHLTAEMDEDHEVFAAIGSQGHAEAVARGVLTRRQTESGDHTCDICKKKHSTKQKKYRCKQSHLPQKSFPCPVPGCDNAFTRPDNVATHVKKKHLQ